MPALNPPTGFKVVILVTASTWPAACSTEAMLSPRMSTPPLLPSRPNDQFNLSIGAPLVSRSVSTTNHQPLFQVVIWPRFLALFVCCPTQLPSLRLGPVWITSLIDVRQTCFCSLVRR